MTDYKTRAAKFIHAIIPYIWEGLKYSDVDLILSGVAAYNNARGKKARVHYGASRVAILSSDYCVKFNYADDETLSSIGDCASETMFYSFAKREGFGYLFAEATLIIIEGKEFEIMPRIRNIGKHNSYIFPFLAMNERDFIQKHVTDMHNHNYGWFKGHPVIIDYAFNDFCEGWGDW